MIEISALVLGKAADAFITALADKVTEEAWSRLQKESARAAFKQALGAAIERFSTDRLRLRLARPLMLPDGLLTNPAVAKELVLLVGFDREPDPNIIGRHWQDALEDPWPSVDFAAEAADLLKLLRAALRGTDEFRPVFDAKTLDALAVTGRESASSLSAVETHLSTLVDLMDAKFGGLSRTFATTSLPIRTQILDFSRLIEEKTHDFVGRAFVFDALDGFLGANPRGYYIIRGDPGIGKTSFAAQLAKTRGCVHHFNVRAEGVNRSDIFLRNVCAQLIAAHGLDYQNLSAEAYQDGEFLNRLLIEVAGGLDAGEQEIIVVDALDEVDIISLPEGTNPLYLPQSLPEGVYIVVTLRRAPLHLRIECEQDTLDLEQDLAGNVADVRLYVEQAVPRNGIQDYINSQGIDADLFVDHLVEKSQGNFMYLKYVLPEIERGAYSDLRLDEIPAGLQNYYEDHWRRLRGRDESAWFEYRLPVLASLTVAKKPISVDLIAGFSGVDSRARISGVLEDFAQFLYQETMEHEGVVQKRFRLYHASFHDFIAAKDQVAEERVNLREVRRRMALNLYEGLYGDESSGSAPT